MVAPRKKTSGFSSKPAEQTEEEKEIEEFINEVTSELFEEEKETPSSSLVIESITPSEDTGPRFIQTPEEKVITREKKQPKLLDVPEEGTTRVVIHQPQSPEVVSQISPKELAVHPPKRNRRNIPRFSRFKEA